MISNIKKVVIVGREADAWLAALALQHRFPYKKCGVEIELIELPPRINKSDCYVTSPFYKAFHDFLPVEESILLKQSKGLNSYGQRFTNWCGPAPAYMHAYDRHGHDFNKVDFFQYWVRAKKSGLDVPLERFSLGAMSALNNRYIVFTEQTQHFSNATYGYNLDSNAYIAAIARVALGLGLKHRRDFVDSVEVDDGKISKLNLHGGGSVSADLFIDATGDEARLISSLETKDNFCAWTKWFPCDKKVVASEPYLKPVPSFSQITAFKDGWFGRYPLLDRTAVSAMINTERASLEECLHNLSVLCGTRLENVEVAEMLPGARKQSWIGNCCAVGSASASFEPLDALDLYAAQIGIMYLSLLLPLTNNYQEERQLYNEKVLDHFNAAKDYQSAHYLLNSRRGDELWDKARSVDAQDKLARKINLYKKCGKISMEENELFQEESWYSLFVGQGLIPESYDPLVNVMPEQEQIAKFQAMLAYISKEVEAMPMMQTETEMRTESDKGSFF